MRIDKNIGGARPNNKAIINKYIVYMDVVLECNLVGRLNVLVWAVSTDDCVSYGLMLLIMYPMIYKWRPVHRVRWMH